MLPLFLPQSHARSPAHDDGYQATAQSQQWEGSAGQQETLLPKITNHRRPSRQEVLEESFLLSQRAEGQQQVEELVAVADIVKMARGAALRHGAGEEEGRQDKQQHLQREHSGRSWSLLSR